MEPPLQPVQNSSIAERSILLFKDAVNGQMYYNTFPGDVYRIPGQGTDELMYAPDDHGITRLQGMVFHEGDQIGRTMGTFSPHRSPMGLVFDLKDALSGEFRVDGFVIGYSSMIECRASRCEVGYKQQ